MPIPKPRDNETEDDFISRCMGAIGGEYEQDQALAICYGQWRDRGKDMAQRPSTRDALVAAAKTGASTDLMVRKALVPDEVKEVDGQTRRLRFVISTGAVDRDNDTINPTGWDLKSYLKNPVVLWAHDYRQLPVARALSVSMENGKLVSECEFADHEFAETVLRLLKGGFLRATSVGFRPRKYTINEDRHGLDFTEQELMEYSIVPVPANPEALVDMAAAKAAGIDVEPLVVWAKGILTPETTLAADPPKKPCGCTGTEDEHQEGCSNKPKAPPPPDEDEEEDDEKGKKPCACPGGPNDHDPGCQYFQKPPKAADPTCRLCQRQLPVTMPRLTDDLGLVCAPCFMQAALPTPAVTDVPPVPATPTKAADADPSVLDLDDAPCEDAAVELDDDSDPPVVVDLSPEDVRAALRSAVTSAVSTLVQDETRAALNRARGRVD